MSGVSSTSEKHSEVVGHKRKSTRLYRRAIFPLGFFIFYFFFYNSRSNGTRKERKKRGNTQWQHSKTNRNCHADVDRFRFPAVCRQHKNNKKKEEMEAGRQDKQPTAEQITNK